MHEHSSCLAALRPQCKYQSLTQSISVDASCPPVQNDATIPNQAPALSGPRVACCHVISTHRNLPIGLISLVWVSG